MAETKTAKKTSFVQRVLDKLKGGEEAKLARFHKKALKYNTDQIKLRRDAIEELKEKRADKQEEYEDALLNIDEDSIKTVDAVNSYVPDYVRRMFRYQGEIEELDAEIELKEKEIAKFEQLSGDLA